jgi:glycosyltransferase involved in cell wall biosynthesis
VTGQRRSRLRLAIFTSHVPWGASESFVLTEIAELQRHADVVLVIPARSDRTMFHGRLARQIGEVAIRLPVMSLRMLMATVWALLRAPRQVGRVLFEVVTGSTSRRVLLKNLAILPKSVYVAGLVERLGIDHIHAHWASVPATMALVSARLTGIPWSFTAHRWDIEEDNLLGLKIRTAAFARAISDRGRARMLAKANMASWPSLVTLHMGTSVPGETERAPGQGNGTFSFACIANLLEVKGHRYLVEACRLLKERGRRFTCHIIGDGPLRREIGGQIMAAQLGDRVVMRGALPHEEVIRMLRGGEVGLVVLPSVRTADGAEEGIPVVLMEAMAQRVPTIATDSGAIGELLGDGAGVLVRAADAAALADAIERIVLDAGFRARVVERGFARVRDEFNLTSVAGQLACMMAGGQCAEPREKARH